MIARALLYLSAGAILSVLSGWSSAAAAHLIKIKPESSCDAWAAEVPVGWPTKPDLCMHAERFYVSVIINSSSHTDYLEGNEPWRRLHIVRYGIPFHGLASTSKRVTKVNGAESELCPVLKAGINFPAAVPGANSGLRRIALWIRPIEFIGNTIVYSFICCGIACAAKYIVKARSISKGYCAMCGYDLHDAMRCPECGHPLPAARHDLEA